MPKILQFRTGDTTSLASILGAEAELFVDTSKVTIVVMDGVTTGGTVLATENHVSSYVLSYAQTNDLVSRSFVTSVLGMRNLIMNGDMRIAQRSTSVASITTSAYRTIDRFYFHIVNGGTWTMSQDSDIPAGQGFDYSLKLTCTVADTDLAGGSDQFFIDHRIEGLNLQHLNFGTAYAQPLTLSFWVKSNKTGTYVAAFFNTNATRQTNKTYTIDAANTWEKKTITINGDTVTDITNDNTAGLYVRFPLGFNSSFSSGTSPDGTWENYSNANSYAGSTINLADSNSNYINITGVQLEIGNTATPFEHRPYEQELARCQRYYYKLFSTGGAESFGVGFNLSATVGNYLTPFPVTMRTAPTALEQSGTAGHYRIQHLATSTVCSAVPANVGNSPWQAKFSFTVASGLTSGQGSIARAETANAAYLAWSADL